MQDTIWIDWDKSCRRSKDFCEYLQITLYLVKSSRPKLISLVLQTVWLFLKIRPRVLFVASMRLALLALVFKPFFRYKLIVDCHYSGIVPNSSIPRIFHFNFRFIHRNSDLVLVTNLPHAEVVRAQGGASFVLQDKIPTSPHNFSAMPNFATKKVVCICSYSSDEPIIEMLQAARQLAATGICFYFTGDSNGQIEKDALPSNVVLTGYLPENEYWQLLNEANVIVDLTTRNNCLVSGAYEAAALGKPMVLSNTAALRRYFTQGVVFTEITEYSIAESIYTAFKFEEELVKQVKELKHELEFNWNPLGENLKYIISNMRSINNFLLQQVTEHVHR